MDPAPQHTENVGPSLLRIVAQIRQAEDASGRLPGSVRLLPVTKRFPVEYIQAAMRAGMTRFGENLVQEALRKFEELGAQPTPEWAIIGHLQTNKAKYVARFASEFQALDSVGLAEALQRRLDIEDRSLDVLIQVNTSGETTKTGIAAADVPALVASTAPLDRLRVRGFMTIATNGGDDRETRRCFAELRAVRDSAVQQAGLPFDELSMGMSGDFATAIDEGATVVRVGSAIFGSRPLASDAWHEPRGG